MPIPIVDYPPSEDVDRLVEWSLREDGDGRDLTSELVVSAKTGGRYAVVARQAGVFSGRAVLDAFGRRMGDQGLEVSPDVADGQAFHPGQRLAGVAGPRRLVLRIERPLLNFLQRLCGIATLTHRFVEAVKGTAARILDTRKTIPGWRQLDKYAVRCGGGFNHRVGLHDAVLVKDNHLVGVAVDHLYRETEEWVGRARRLDPPPMFVEIEVDSLTQLAEVLKVEGVDRILLDNFTVENLRRAVAVRDSMARGRVLLEASGGISLQSVRSVAQTGIDMISVGELTHSAPAVDLAMDEEDTH